MKEDILWKSFRDPDNRFRSFPFWSWNDRMDPEEIREQIRGMKKAGMGGFFLHSREGLETPYMGKEWMDCVRAAVEAASDCGMYAWLYDEDRWPSGTAGGQVTALGEAYCCKGLTLEICEPSAYEDLIREGNLVALYGARFHDMELDGFRRFALPGEPGTEQPPVPLAEMRSGAVGTAQPGAPATEQPVPLAEMQSGEADAERLGAPIAVRPGVPAVMQSATPAAAPFVAPTTAQPEASVLEGPGGDTMEFLPGERLLAVRLEVSGKSEWFNDQCPPDQLNPDCVRKFLKLTHEKYKALVGGEFGKTVPGIFSDEPSLADTHAFFGQHKGWIPWTYGFGAYFQEKRGYDFLEALPYQYFNGRYSAKVRHDYWRTIAERFSETYSGTIAAWCRRQGIAYTGHFLQEDKLGLCTRVNGSVMPHYALQDIPGIDILTECTEEYLTVKQCTSVAHQFGKKRVLTETYGCTGWDFTLEGQKWVGDWQYVLGVNLRTTHTALYSLRGCRKRDYPPSFNYNNTWWEKNYLVERYFARLGAVLAAGEPVRRILVLHPASTAWCRVGTNPYGNPVRRLERDVPEVNEYGYQLNRLLETLCREHMDCDLGDEMLMGKYGYVKEGRLGIGRAEYDVAVLPRLDTLFASTCALLSQFLEQGGRAAVLEPAPYMVEGDEQRVECLQKVLEHPGCHRVASEEELIAWLEERGMRPLRLLEAADVGGERRKRSVEILGRDDLVKNAEIPGKGGLAKGTENSRESGLAAGEWCVPPEEQKKLLALTVKSGEDTVLFIVNNDRKTACEALVCLPVRGEVEEWDPLTGEARRIACREADGLISHLWGGTAATAGGGGICFKARWEKAGSHLYVIRRNAENRQQNEEDCRQNAANRLRNAADQWQNAAVRLQNAADRRQNTEDHRQNAADCRKPGEKNLAEKNLAEKNLAEKNLVEKDLAEKNLVEKDLAEKDSVQTEKEPLPESTARWSVRQISLPEEVPVRLASPNVLTLDVCRYRLKGEAWSEPLEVWMAQRQIRQRLKMPETGTQRYLWIHRSEPGDGTEVELAFRFRSEEDFSRCFLALESPEEFRVTCNGQEVECRSEGWFLDRSFEKVRLPKLQKGWNELVLRCAYWNRTELENCYLLGEFGVTEERVLVRKPKRMKTGDWTKQGLFHYCGSVAYQYEYRWDGLGRVVLRPGEYAGGCLTVLAGGRTWELPWRRSGKPLEILGEVRADGAKAMNSTENMESAGGLDITEGLQKGANLIQVEVLGSPRNMLGPLHYKEVHPANTGAKCFQPDPEDHVETYQVVPYGLLEAPVLLEAKPS